MTELIFNFVQYNIIFFIQQIHDLVDTQTHRSMTADTSSYSEQNLVHI